jgi:hypothetical protein
MTYGDILDWAEDNLPDELYDDFNDWYQDILVNFEQANHFFPPDMEDSLRAYWNEKYGEEDTASEIDDFDSFVRTPKRTDYVATDRVIVTREANTIFIKEPAKPVRIIEIPPDGFKVTYLPEKTTAEKFREARLRTRRNN